MQNWTKKICETVRPRKMTRIIVRVNYIRNHTVTQQLHDPLLCYLDVDLWPLVSEPIPDWHFHIAASQHHYHLLSATKDKLTLYSTSWTFLIIVIVDIVPWWCCCSESVCGMVRWASLHQNVETGETFWWLLLINCSGDDKSAASLHTHSLAWSSCFWGFKKSCHCHF